MKTTTMTEVEIWALLLIAVAIILETVGRLPGGR